MKYSKTVYGLSLAGVLTALAACSQQPTYSNNCALDPGKNVDRLFEQVHDKLDDRSCHYQFREYSQQLITAAKGAPEAENEARFAGLMRESIDRGIVSRKQGQELFSRYFDTEFHSVKVEPRNNCSALNRKDVLYADMKQELAYKREGLLEILGDENRFRQAQRHYADLQLVLDAVQLACSAEV